MSNLDHEVGDVRITSSYTPVDTHIEVWSGAEWVKLNGVLEASWSAGVGGTCTVKLKVYSKTSLFMVRRENIALEYIEGDA